MAAAETTHSILLSGTAAVTLGGFASLPFGWVMPSWSDGGILLATAIMQCCAHYLMIEAFRYGETSLLAPFKYSGLVWGLVLGFLVWGEFPNTHILFGAAVIIASGIYIAHREAKSR
jgi:drug/metabolite transporter (DMT)-like permease